MALPGGLVVTAKQSDRLPPGPEGQDSGKTGQGLEDTHTGTQVLARQGRYEGPNGKTGANHPRDCAGS